MVNVGIFPVLHMLFSLLFKHWLKAWTLNLKTQNWPVVLMRMMLKLLCTSHSHQPFARFVISPMQSVLLPNNNNDSTIFKPPTAQFLLLI
ncbi:hypothetical protein I7I48_11232 [Histoplasma ohiense]|nr:hypothetical protein I7I48_11232 [Histoplasma ohiense (nom. inval.)]